MRKIEINSCEELPFFSHYSTLFFGTTSFTDSDTQHAIRLAGHSTSVSSCLYIPMPLYPAFAWLFRVELVSSCMLGKRFTDSTISTAPDIMNNCIYLVYVNIYVHIQVCVQALGCVCVCLLMWVPVNFFVLFLWRNYFCVSNVTQRFRKLILFP